MFTRLKSKLVANAADTTVTPSGDIGSQPLPTELSPGKREEKKRAVKVGGSIAEPEVVAVPFGTLPGDFGSHPLLAKEHLRKGVVEEAAAAPVLKVTAGELGAAASNATSKAASNATSKEVTGHEVAAATNAMSKEVTGREVAAASNATSKEVTGHEVAAASNTRSKVTAGEVAADTNATSKEVTGREVAAATNATSKNVTKKVSLKLVSTEVTVKVEQGVPPSDVGSKKSLKAAGKRDRNVAEENITTAKKKTKVQGKNSVVSKEKGLKKKSVTAEVPNDDVIEFDQVEQQPKNAIKKKATNRGKKPTSGKAVDNSVVEVDDDKEEEKQSVLIFPFIVGKKIDTETSSFKLCHFVNSWIDRNYETLTEDEVIKIQQTNCAARRKAAQVTEYDIKTLAPGRFVNDSIIDFWMCWLVRKQIPNESSVHIFSTHFYTKLKDEGYDAIANWTVNKGINVFDKKMILIPVNKEKHWSLCAVINAGYIDYGGISLHVDAFRVPVLVLLDSLQLHSLTEIAENVRTWLNAEYSRVKGKPGSTIFNAFTIRNVDLQGKSIFIFGLRCLTF